jgi:glycerol-3-phosphate dehydrogenase
MKEMRDRMQTDVLVIGGGATGGGIALDLALRGVRVVLAEMGDLATGTSGRYHGLLHSGGRYAVRDAESAKECIDENWILRRIAPQSIEDTGGYFVLCPGDDVGYVDQWLAACAAVNIPTRSVSLSEALRREPTLNPRLEAIYEVPDGTCDSWDLLHAIQAGAEAAGARFLTYHRVEAFHLRDGVVTGATLRNLRDGSPVEVECACIVNAAGPWAAAVAKLAGVTFGMRLSRGAMLAYNIRWVNTVINKLRKPGDGDIFVPVGTVSVIGTTSVRTDDPGDTRVDAWEVTKILDEAEAMTPGISRARILRAWGGVRPLYDPGGDQRDAKRTFATLDHAEDGAAGLMSIVGGKLTTYRLMAEKISDRVCALLGVSAPCTTATTPLPAVHGGKNKLHQLRGRLDALEHGQLPGALVCECEIVTETQIADALAHGDVVSLNDLRRDLRLGMGPCQGGFCSYRAAAIRHEIVRDSLENTRTLLGEFVERRIGGMKALLWGHNLRQALLAEQIYGRIIGLSAQPPTPTARVGIGTLASARPETPPRILVVGAGLSGLMAALAALELGARVEVVAVGQGAVALHPGWIEIGDVESLRRDPTHPYATVGDSLEAGLGLLNAAIPLTPVSMGVTALGSLRPVAYAAGGALHDLPSGARIAVFGAAGWRDFYTRTLADGLNAAGFRAEAHQLTLPHLGGNFDNWSVDLANWLDTADGMARLIALAKPLINGADAAIFPAILGFAAETRAQISAALGVPVIEVPTLPPSVSGLRLYNALRRAVLAKGGRVTIGAQVTRLETLDGRAAGAWAGTAANGRARRIDADAIILATGGLYNGGLDSDYTGRVYEPIGGLHVTGVPPLAEWMVHPTLSGERQPIHNAGVAVDGLLRPINADGVPIYENLYAVGRLLGGYSPVQQGCAEGVDIASGVHAAYQAVMNANEQRQVTHG